MTILVVRAGALGDTLLATPVVRALRRQYPQAEIDFLCAATAHPLLELDPDISRLFLLHNRNVPFAVSLEKRRLVRDLSARRYGFAVLLESTDSYHELLRRAGVGEIRSIRKTFDPALHSVVNNLRAAGLTGDDPPSPQIHTAPRDEMRADEMLRGLAHPIIGLHAGYGPPRRKDAAHQGERLKGWGAENFARLAESLRARLGASIVLTGSGADIPEAERIRAALSAQPLMLAGRTSVRELAAVIERLDLLISVDSAPAHFAAALGTKLVVLWGPAILEQMRPVGDAAKICVVRHAVYCAPCYGTPMMKQCRRNICMEAISPERVAKEAEGLLYDATQRK